MNCPECKSDDVTQDHTHADSLGVVCVCVACEGTWIDGEASKTFCPGEARRALQSQIDRDDFQRAFNDPEGFGL
jgi:transcription initiation factor TFIIIB Brf1 subunit/transcription initiation factor TFIIB